LTFWLWLVALVAELLKVEVAALVVCDQQLVQLAVAVR
jgi:hypothetical protein